MVRMGKPMANPSRRPTRRRKQAHLEVFSPRRNDKHIWLSRDVSIATPKGIGNRSVRSGRQSKLLQAPPLLHPQLHQPADSQSFLAFNAVFHPVPSMHSPVVLLEGKQKGASVPAGLLRAYGSAQGHQFSILFDTSSSEDLISPQLAHILQCSMSPC